MKNLPQVAFLILLFLIGSIGNISTCLIIKRNLRLQNLHNALIINLVVIDMVVVWFSMLPIITAAMLGEWSFGDIFCHVSGYVLVTMNIASLWNIVALSICRYLLLQKPSIYAVLFIRQNMILLLLGIWLTAGISSSVVYAVGSYRYFPDFHACYAKFNEVRTNFIVLSVVVFTPTAFVIILSVSVVTHLKHQKPPAQRRRIQRRSMFQIAKTTFSNDETENRAAYTYLVLVVILALCWGPLLVIHAVNQTNPKLLNQHVFAFGTVLGFLPFVLKPFVYLITKTDFRKKFLQIYKCGSNTVAPNSSLELAVANGRARRKAKQSLKLSDVVEMLDEGVKVSENEDMSVTTSKTSC